MNEISTEFKAWNIRDVPIARMVVVCVILTSVSLIASPQSILDEILFLVGRVGSVVGTVILVADCKGQT
jgi:energy-converting hydrogenase Eha subunit F